MSRKQNKTRDPEKRAAKRAAQRESIQRGGLPSTKRSSKPSQSQLTRASSSKANKKRSEGEKKLQRDRDAASGAG